MKDETKENNSIMECCICNNYKKGEFIVINDKKYHLDCITNLQEEIERLNNIINKLEKDINVLMKIIENNDIECTSEENDVWEKWYFKLKELRGDNNANS